MEAGEPAPSEPSQPPGEPPGLYVRRRVERASSCSLGSALVLWWGLDGAHVYRGRGAVCMLGAGRKGAGPVRVILPVTGQSQGLVQSRREDSSPAWGQDTGTGASFAPAFGTPTCSVSLTPLRRLASFQTRSRGTGSGTSLLALGALQGNLCPSPGDNRPVLPGRELALSLCGRERWKQDSDLLGIGCSLRRARGAGAPG